MNRSAAVNRYQADQRFLARVMASKTYRELKARADANAPAMTRAHASSGIVLGARYRTRFPHAGLESVVVTAEQWVPCDAPPRYPPFYLCRLEGVVDPLWRNGRIVRRWDELEAVGG